MQSKVVQNARSLPKVLQLQQESYLNKKLALGKNTTYFSKGCSDYATARNHIHKFQSAYEILSFLQKNPSKYDTSVYAEGIKRCNSLNINNCHTSQQIMQLMYKHDIPRSIITYNLLFRSFGICDEMHFLPKYFDFMIKDEIQPNIFLATTILNGYKSRTDIKNVRKFWNLTIVKYNLVPDKMLYTQLISIYARMGDILMCEQIFHTIVKYSHLSLEKKSEEEEKSLNGEIEIDHALCGALLSCYASIGNISKSLKLLSFMKSNSISFKTSIIFSNVMSCYLKNNECWKAIQLFNNAKYTRGVRIDDMLLNLYSTAYHKLLLHELQKNYSMDIHISRELCVSTSKYFYVCNSQSWKVNEYVNKILTDIPNERENEYNIKRMSHYFGQLQLHTLMIIFTHNYDRNLMGKKDVNFLVKNQTMIDMFHLYCDEKYTRYWTIDGSRIEIHHYFKPVMEFVLRYIFYYECNILQALLNKKRVISIVCGQKRHSKKNYMNEGEPAIDFVHDLLLTFEPIIHSSVDEENRGVLVLDSNDVQKYLHAFLLIF